MFHILVTHLPYLRLHCPSVFYSPLFKTMVLFYFCLWFSYIFFKLINLRLFQTYQEAAVRQRTLFAQIQQLTFCHRPLPKRTARVQYYLRSYLESHHTTGVAEAVYRSIGHGQVILRDCWSFTTMAQNLDTLVTKNKNQWLRYTDEQINQKCIRGVKISNIQ